jgi:hypothetical protein
MIMRMSVFLNENMSIIPYCCKTLPFSSISERQTGNRYLKKSIGCSTREDITFLTFSSWTKIANKVNREHTHLQCCGLGFGGIRNFFCPVGSKSQKNVLWGVR